MPLVPLKIPAGLYRNGTPYTGKNRWADGNLVRWHDGAIRPIGGWQRRTAENFLDIAAIISDPTLEAVRDLFTWRDLDNKSNTVLGSNVGLYHLDNVGVVTDITYAGFVSSDKDMITFAGYGENPYGFGAYGAANPLTGIDPILPARWYYSNFGEILITGSRANGGMYELDIATLTLSLVTNAPTDVQDAIVTDERQVLAIGGGDIPRRLQASDIEDRTDWTPATNNQSIDRVIAGNGKLLRIINVLNSILILGENDANVAQYIGPPYVYRVDIAGENCGPLDAGAIAKTDRFAVWWGDRNFWLFDGTVRPVPCDVIDFLYEDLDFFQRGKISTFTNTDYSEIWWLYQSTSTTTTEVDSYVMWDYQMNTWQTGRLNRTAALDKGILTTVLAINPDGEIFNHELSDTFPSEGECFIESGPLDIADGAVNMAVRYIYPDTAATGGITFTLKGRQLPNAQEFDYGPYAYQQQQPIPTRAIGRQLRLRVDMTDAMAELGEVRFDIANRGTGGR
jgi:hypothetical protein